MFPIWPVGLNRVEVELAQFCIGIARWRYAMPTPVVYRIRVKGHLDRSWSLWFEGLTLTHEPGGETVMAGPVRDQAALFGLLMKIRDLGLVLISVNRAESEPACSQVADRPA